MSTKIGWTNETWNPIVGCSKISPGCESCYAEKMANRLHGIQQSDIARSKVKHNFQIRVNEIRLSQYCGITENGKWTGKTAFVESALKKPLHWKNPRMIFTVSMGDLFHESVPFEWIDKVLEVMGMCEQHTFQILTKRPERMKEYFEYVSKCDAEMGEPAWHDMPNPNVWLGVTAENQEQADKRIPILLQIPAAKRFISCEPLLEKEVNINKHIMNELKRQGISLTSSGWKMPLDWVIVGCESGPKRKRRECKIEWIESVVEQCKAAQVPVFVKQIEINGKIEDDVNKFSESIRFQEYPVKNSRQGAKTQSKKNKSV